MLVVALGSLGLAGLVALLAFWRDRWTQRAHDRERQAWAQDRTTLVAQVCHLADKPWSPPPIRTVEKPAEPADRRPEWATF